MLTFIKNSSNCTGDLTIATYWSRKLQKIDRGKTLSTNLPRRGSFTGQSKNLLAYLPAGKARNLCRRLTSFKAEENKVVRPALWLRLTHHSDVVGLYDKEDLSPIFIKSNA
ncbi:hypothetical protein BPOR_0475g00020 [Botrytis porri]|uniref:Uncharacterized protein n=1 Tax=Botrytis porri TaxID=87229 RepID=A0A4Z1KRL7_9HELO|nr:hypothetical protein BPOR_0475g00020 [Botrytis porri]